MKNLKKVIALLAAVALCFAAGCSVGGDNVSWQPIEGDASSSEKSTYSAPSRYSAPASSDVSSAFSSAFSSHPSYPSSAFSSAFSSAISSVKPSSSTSSIAVPAYVQEIINDMKLPHDARPHGVPTSYNWSQKPREGYGVNMPSDWSATIAWGQVYEALEGNPATNTRVQLRNMRLYYFSKSKQKWITLQSTASVTGNAYREDFKNNANISADERSEASNGGGVSVTAGNGYNYHFWPAGVSRATIDPKDIALIYATCQARLIVGDKNKPDDRDKAKYLLSVGGDYWFNTTIGWAEFKTNGDFAIGRFKYVKKEWGNFSGWAGDENILRKNPPPTT